MIRIPDAAVFRSTCGRGGAINADDSSSLSLYDSRLLGCTATSSGPAGGGAIYLGKTSQLTLDSVSNLECAVRSDSYSVGGGGIDADSGSEVLATSTLISGCRAESASSLGSGGGLRLYGISAVTLTLHRTNISRCVASSSGGAIFAIIGFILFDNETVLSGAFLQDVPCASCVRGGATVARLALCGHTCKQCMV